MPPPTNPSGEYPAGDPWKEYRERVQKDISELDDKVEALGKDVVRLETQKAALEKELDACWKKVNEIDKRPSITDAHSPVHQPQPQPQPQPTLMQRSAPYTISGGMAGAIIAIVELLKAMGAS